MAEGGAVQNLLCQDPKGWGFLWIDELGPVVSNVKMCNENPFSSGPFLCRMKMNENCTAWRNPVIHGSIFSSTY